MDFIRPARERRDESDPAVVTLDRPRAVGLALDHVAVETPAGLAHVPRLGGQLALDHRGDERIRVDLSVRMAQRDPDLLATVLEDVDVTHVGQATELVRAVAPDLDQVAYVVDALLSEGRVVRLRVAHDLGATLVARIRRKSVFEDDDVVRRLWDLGLRLTWPGRAEGAVLRRRMVSAVLAPRRHGDPFFEQGIPPQLAHVLGCS